MTGETPDDGRPHESARVESVAYPIAETETPVEAVVRAVASFTNTPVLELNPIYNVIDLEPLERLFDSAADGDGTPDLSVSFRFSDCLVTVTREAVHVQPSADDGN
ncbi:MAG: HalOD1 output domain-containing protein [Haloplanus sp.]